VDGISSSISLPNSNQIHSLLVFLPSRNRAGFFALVQVLIPALWGAKRRISMPTTPFFPDLASIAGHFHAKRALEVAACGGHNLALIGGPGHGKTLLAQALIGLLPLREYDVPRPVVKGQEAMTWIEAALGGHIGQLGQAQHGVLLLDRLDCFVYSALQIQCVATVFDRVHDVQMVLTAQPCPCGMYGDPIRECSCSAQLIQRHQRRMQALMERIAITVEIPRLDYESLVDARAQEGSDRVAARALEGAQRQQERFAGGAITRNAEMDHAQILRWCEMDASAQKLYKAACQHLHVSGRTADDVLAVARTIADLANSDRIQANHVAEAVAYRSRW
jgi:magnesium chelatase family protein